MSPITHALLPAMLAVPWLPKTDKPQFRVSFGAVALSGVLPDLLNPHVSLAARHASWSHSVFAVAAFVVACATGVRFARQLHPMTAWLAPVAYASHLFLDAISGGIAWLHPVSAEVVGGHFVRFEYWFLIDVVVVVLAAGVLAWIETRSAQPGPADAAVDR